MNGWILEKVEDGWKKWLDTTAITGSVSGSLPITVYRGMDLVEKLENNAVIVSATNHQQVDYGMNIYRTTVNLSYRYCPDVEEQTGSINYRNASYKLLTQVIFNNNNLIANLVTNSTNLAIYDLEIVGTRNQFDGAAWVSDTDIEMVCCISGSN